MAEHSLTLGAHLLLWGFPLALVILVVVESVHDHLTRKGTEP
jgi:cytochrome c-type biogenesis protein CcmH/NrfF